MKVMEASQSETMKAFVYERYGSPEVLQLRDVEKPRPQKNEIRIKIYATTVTAGDWRLRSLEVPAGFGLMIRLVFGISKPRQPILGMELAGVVDAIGSSVSQFKVGDAVFAFCDGTLGCYAEYQCIPENGTVALKPSNLTYGEAAALSFGGTTALGFFKRGKLRHGEHVLVNGASGSVGSAAVQLARYFGAEVTAVCSAANGEWVRSLGANHVIDYQQTDFLQQGETYDVIMDTVGTAPFSRSQRVLKPHGRLLLVLAGLPEMLGGLWGAMMSRKKLKAIAGPASARAEDLCFLAKLAESDIFKPRIDRCYPFEQMVEAHRYVDTGRKKGNVVIRLMDEDGLNPISPKVQG